MRYQAVVTKQGRATLAQFPDCPGCHTQADPGEDILELARDALEGWLEAHLVLGRVPPLAATTRRRAPAHARLVDVPVGPSLAVRILLRVARHEAGLTQGALARKVGVSQQQIASLESPDANLTLGTLVKVAAALDHEVEISLPRATA
jgi:antitoxin HicB